ncbi:MAG TPA: glycosyltransferase family 2 protein [Kiritimatiellia bacterium]|nr:glycosyltransferase family 2 protein [Kiritimatiellia bacterium]
MSFVYSRAGLEGAEARRQRLLEILPGATSWTVLLGMFTLGLCAPQTAAALVIAFNLYWLLRLAHSTIFLVFSYALLRAERRADWPRRLAALTEGAPPPDLPLSRWLFRGRWRALRDAGVKPLDPGCVHHVVIIPIVKEQADVVEPGLRSLREQDFPTDRILVVLAVEARAEEAVRRDAERLAEQYRAHFLACEVALHPADVPGEARVKGANATFAARRAAELLRARGIPFAHVTASCFDADTVVPAHYISCLTYHFCLEPDRTRASYQPIPVYHNNIWAAPGFARVLEVGSSFFQLIEATNPDTLVTFSSHSMSFQALHEVGGWPVDMISDDSAIFWKSYLHYEGDYRVVPMYTTVSMDIVAERDWARTLRGLYKQKRRWAWGAENFPLLVRGFLQARRIPWREKFWHTLKMYEGLVAWATWGFMLSIINWLPALFAGREFSSTVMYFTAPRISGLIFNLAGLALLTTIILSQLLVPRPPSRRPILVRIRHAFEWLFIPFITLFFSAIPALDAQTRLMLGKRMEFWVAGKGGGGRPS